jgi:hypothetical protein
MELSGFSAGAGLTSPSPIFIGFCHFALDFQIALKTLKSHFY